MPTRGIRISDVNYSAIKAIANNEGCTVSFIGDLAVSQFLRSGLDIASLRKDIEAAYAVAINKFLITKEEVSRETNI